MTERIAQKPVVHMPTQQEIEQLDGEGALTRPISRRTFLKKASIAVAGLALAGSLGGVFGSCGNTETPTTSSTPVTTESSTTTTEAQVEIPKTFTDLVDHTMTGSDLKGVIMKENISFYMNVSAKLQAEYQAAHRNLIIGFIGEHNIAEDPDSLEGNQLNAAWTQAGGEGLYTYGATNVIYEQPGIIDGILLKDENGKRYISIGGLSKELVEKPIILIEGSNDFYLHGINPQTGDNYYSRIVRDSNSKYGEPTILNCISLGQGVIMFDDAISSKYPKGPSELYKNRKNHFANTLTDEEWVKFIVFGEVALTFSKGNNDDFAPSEWVVDENGIPVDRTFMIYRNDPWAGEINALFK